MRNNIDSYGPLEKYIEPSIRQEFIAKLNQTIDWIYGEGESASKDEYKKRLDEFKKVGLPVKERARFHDEFPVYLEQFKVFT